MDEKRVDKLKTRWVGGWMSKQVDRWVHGYISRLMMCGWNGEGIGRWMKE